MNRRMIRLGQRIVNILSVIRFVVTRFVCFVRQPFPFFFSFCTVQGGTMLFCRA
jgi:hypothetical protein